MFKDALGGFKETQFTKVGRALTKHPEMLKFINTEDLMKAFNSADKINNAASAALKIILREGTKTIQNAPRLGERVIQYTLDNGFGARWTLDGKFVGFIKP